jgi:hypothetical protein
MTRLWLREGSTTRPRKTPLLGILLALLLLPSIGQSALINQGSTTLDDQTNLQWLDLTLTMGQSLKEVEEGPYFANGFRSATVAEVLALFNGNGISLSSALSYQERIDQFDAVTTMVNLLGPTIVPSPDFNLISGYAGWTFIGGGNPVNDNCEVSDLRTYTNFNLGELDTPYTIAASYQGSNNAQGHYLLRSVPEPGTLSLFLVGAVLLGFRSRTP